MATYINARSVVVNESEGFADVVVTLSAPSASVVTVTYSVTYSTAQFNDFTATSGTLSFAANETSKTIRVTLANDTAAEAHESLYLRLSNAVNAAIGNTNTIITLAANDQSPGVPQASVRDVVVDESGGTALFTVVLDKPASADVSLTWSTAGLNAVAGVDFSALSGTLTFTPGQTTRSFEVPILEDALAEGDEFFAVTIASVGNGIVVAQGQALARIVANDATPVSQPVIIAENAIVNEAAGYAEIVVRLSAPSAQQVSIGYNVANTQTTNADVNTSLSGSLIFAPGETVRVLRVDIGDDNSFEPTESFYVQWQTPVGGVLAQTYSFGTIQDNDGSAGTPLVGIRDVRVDESAGVARFVVWLDKPSNSLVRVNYGTVDDSAAAGSDFQAMSGTVSFLPGETLTVVQVPLFNDTQAEGGERFAVDLSSPVGATLGQARGWGFIAPSDNTPASNPTVGVESIVANESQGYVDVVLRLSAPSTQQVSVRLSDDYYGPFYLEYAYGYATTVVFAPGEVEKSVRYVLHDDTELEPMQFFRANLQSPVNAVLGNTYAQVSIAANDNDSGTPLISVADTMVDERSGLAAVVITLDRASVGVVTVNWTAVQGSGTAVVDADFRSSGSKVVFAPGETTATVYVPIIDDGDAEGGELFTVQLSGATGATLARAEGAVWIGPSDGTTVGTPVARVQSTFVNEQDGYVDVMVTLSAPSTQNVSLRVQDYYSYSSIDYVDYSYNTTQTLTFAPGETLKTIRYSLTADNFGEGPESFAVNLDTPVNLAIGNPYAIVTIARNDEATGTPVITVHDAVVDEKNGLAQFHIVLDRPSTEVVSFNFETSALNAGIGDFGARSGQLRFSPGQTATTVTVPVFDDTDTEPDELFTLTLSNLVNATAGQTTATARIVANDGTVVSSPVVSVQHLLADEYQGYVDFVVRLSAPSSQQVSVTWNDDYIGLSYVDHGYNYDGVLVFAPGETSKTVRVMLNDDVSDEPAESFFVQLSAPVNAAMGNSRALVTLVASDRSSGTPVVLGNDVVVDEKAGSAVFSFWLDKPSTQTTSFAWTTQHVTTDDGDILVRQGTLTFVPGQVQASVVVPVFDDLTAESAEFFNLVLSQAQGLVLAQDKVQARIGASDNTVVSSPVVHVESTVVNENAGYVEAVIRLSAPSSQQVTVSYADSYVGNSYLDFSYSNGGTLVFAPGETLKTVRWALYGDTETEPAESFYVQVHTPTNAVIGQPYGLVTIAPSDGTGTTAYLRVDDVTVDEKAGSATFIVSLSQPGTEVVSLSWSTANGTALASTLDAPGDFVAGSGTLAFAPGETVRRVTVPINDDTVDESEELFFLDLSGASGATIAQSRGTARIGLSDGTLASAPVITVESVVVNESTGFGEAVLKLSRPGTQQVSVAFAVAAENTSQTADYGSGNSGTAIFAPGETLKTIRWSLTDDTTGEGFESFSVRLTTPVNATIGSAYGFMSIAPNDGSGSGLPSASVSSVVVDERDGMARFVVTLDRPSTELVSFNWGTVAGTAGAGSDFVASSGSVSFWPGETTRTLLVPLIDDASNEADESFSVQLSAPLGAGIAQGAGTARIVANDQATVATPQLIVEAATVSEESGYVDVVVRLSAPSTNQISVNYSDAYSPNVYLDYAYGNSGSLVFPAGTTVRTIRYAIVDDALVENNETFTVTLNTPVNATLGTASAVVTIQDRDGGPQATITDDNGGTTVAGVNTTFTITFSEAVTGLAADDFNLVNVGSVVSFGGTGSSYTLVVSPAADAQGFQTVTLKTNAVTNTLGVSNGPASGVQPIDTLAPSVSAFNPVNAAQGVRLNANIVLTLSEPVAFGSGTLVLARGGTTVETFNVATPGARLQLSADGRTLTIDPAANLLPDGDYTLSIGAGALRDAVNLPIAALSGYGFRSAPNAAPGGSVSVVGNPLVGQTLTVQNTLTDGDGLGTFSYQWLRNGEPIGGATSASYAIVGADVAATLAVRVSYTDGGGTLESATSQATLAVTGGTVINGTTGPETLAGTSGPDTISGGNGDDVMTGGGGNDSLAGGDDNDRLIGGDGADTLDGGAGAVDIADYRGATPLNVNLATGVASYGGANDTVINIEAIFGSAAADTIIGTSQAENLRGETIRGGSGNDTIDGAGGNDSAEFSGPRAGYRVSRDLGTGVITVTDIDLSNGDDGTDTLSGIERLMFSDQMVAFGTRAEDIARVAMVLWSPAILGSSALFSRGYSFYDVGYSFTQMSQVALQFWGQLSDSQLAAQLVANSGTTKSAVQLLGTSATNGGGEPGRAAMVREAALDPSITGMLTTLGVKSNGAVADYFVQDFGTLFGLLPG